MMKQPRQHSKKHLKFIRGLPCVVCGDNTSTEAAHIRFSCAEAGKRHVGMGEKPDDRWTVPLCGECHRKQHRMNEWEYWQSVNRDPILISLALWGVSGNHELGEQIALASR